MLSFVPLRGAALVTAAVAILCCGTSSLRAAARDDKTDLFLLGQFATSDDTTFQFQGQSLDLEYDDTLSLGIGVGRNFNNHLNVNGTVLFTESTLNFSNGFSTASEDATLVAPDVNVDWNFLDGNVTPFVTAGAGMMLFFFDDFDEIDFSYGGGAGVRWDVSDEMFMKVWYRARWFELDRTDDGLMLHTFNIGIGIMR
jgi:opacity protein-like surface antigen